MERTINIFLDVCFEHMKSQCIVLQFEQYVEINCWMFALKGRISNSFHEIF